MLRAAFVTILLSVSATACDSEETVDTTETREARVADHTSKMMAHLDADGSGALSADEAKGSLFEKHFAKADLDGSGEVDPAELDEFTSTMADKHGAPECHGDCEGGCDHHGGHGSHGGHAGHKAHGGDKAHGGSPAEHADAMIAKFDSNDDGSLGRDEVEGRLAEHFETMDGDGDGTVTRDEFVTAIEAKMSKHGKGHHGHHMKSHE